MTRIETFVDAAFAFALTMLVISVENIPQTPNELLLLSKDIPAFLVSGLLIGFIWYRHSQWSRQFGQQDRTTIFLSMCLVMLMLIFLYPVKMVFIGMFAWLSNGYLLNHAYNITLEELSNLFVYYAAGFICLAVIFYFFHWNTLKHADALRLTRYERYFCKTESYYSIIIVMVAILSAILAKTLSGRAIIISGFVYVILFVIGPTFRAVRDKKAPKDIEDVE